VESLDVFIGAASEQLGIGDRGADGFLGGLWRRADDLDDIVDRFLQVAVHRRDRAACALLRRCRPLVGWTPHADLHMT
jgi:hypothetical protein